MPEEMRDDSSHESGESIPSGGGRKRRKRAVWLSIIIAATIAIVGGCVALGEKSINDNRRAQDQQFELIAAWLEIDPDLTPDQGNQIQAAVMWKCDNLREIVDNRGDEVSAAGMALGPLSANYEWKRFIDETLEEIPYPEQKRAEALMNAAFRVYCPEVTVDFAG